MISRTEMELRLMSLIKEENAAISRLNMALARKSELRKELLEKGEDPLKSIEYSEYAQKEMQAFAQANALSGAKQEAEHWINVLDQRFGPGGGPDELPIGGLSRVPAQPTVQVDPN